MSRSAQVTVDLDHLRHNFALARHHAGVARVMAMVKANAYGHGAVAVARALSAADAFGVACLDEALALRAAGIERPILLAAGFFGADELPEIVRHDLQIAVHSERQVADLLAARLSCPLVVWLKIDSGMHRLGIAPETVAATHGRLLASPNVAEVRFMTHFACADTPQHDLNRRQLSTFAAALGRLPGARSLANSAALLALPESRADWVRPGILIYGVNPFAEHHPVADALRPVLTLSSRVVAVRTLAAGEGIGYGHDWVAPRTTRVGIVAMGYGDGYPRHAATGTPVLAAGRRTRLLGRVSMDLLAVDLSDVPEADVGAEVVLWGEGLPAWEVARSAGTIAYELLTGIGARVPVRYRGAGDPGRDRA
ncbi:MAG: alanine racemase [Porticoccaceae bacterium]